MLLLAIFTRPIRTIKLFNIFFTVLDMDYTYKTSKYLDSLSMFKESYTKVSDFIAYIKGTILGSVKKSGKDLKTRSNLRTIG
jgi:hypothetical protein